MTYFDMEIIHPYETNDLVRVGQLKDGGYVINKRVFEHVNVVIGLGINADWSFEEDFVRQATKAIEVYGYDFSVSGDIFHKEYISRILYLFSLKFLLRLVKNPGNMTGLIRQNYQYALLAGNTHRQFPKFFDGTRNKFFQLGVSNEKKSHFIRFNDVIQNLRTEPGPNSIFLKIDIEFSEYRIMEDVFHYSDKICGMVIEFHELDVVWEQFSRIMEAAKKDFVLTHVHANNYGDFIPGTKIPVALEVTFVNKNIIKEKLQLSALRYPLSGLDYPNDPSKADLPLCFDMVR
jgi:hypothetical protein